MFEIKKESLGFNAYIDGKLQTKIVVIAEIHESKMGFRIIIRDSSISEKLFNYKISEINNLHLLSLQIGSRNSKKRKEIKIINDREIEDDFNKKYKVYISIPTNSQREGFPFGTYFEELEKSIYEFNKLNNTYNITFSGSQHRRVEISFLDLDLIQKIGVEIENLLMTVDELHQKTIYSLKNKNKFNVQTLETLFMFPDEIKISCEQYLLYFAQFLRDLGINATSELKEDAGKVLFSVKPIDDVEALGKIREALAVYLNLPSGLIFYDDSFAAMRLQQQVENLQHSQKMAVREIQVNEKLLLAQSDMIREKNITISQQQSVIENQNKIIEKISSKSIMMDSAENKEELEEVCEGLKIGKSKFLMEQLGVHLNPATFARGIGKNILGKQETNSIIETDKETK